MQKKQEIYDSKTTNETKNTKLNDRTYAPLNYNIKPSASLTRTELEAKGDAWQCKEDVRELF